MGFDFNPADAAKSFTGNGDTSVTVPLNPVYDFNWCWGEQSGKSDLTWSALDKILDFNGSTLMFECGCPNRQPLCTQDDSVFYIVITFPRLFGKVWQNGALFPADDPTKPNTYLAVDETYVRSQISGLVDTPWMYGMPGGLFGTSSNLDFLPSAIAGSDWRKLELTNFGTSTSVPNDNTQPNDKPYITWGDLEAALGGQIPTSWNNWNSVEHLNGGNITIANTNPLFLALDPRLRQGPSANGIIFNLHDIYNTLSAASAHSTYGIAGGFPGSMFVDIVMGLYTDVPAETSYNDGVGGDPVSIAQDFYRFHTQTANGGSNFMTQITPPTADAVGMRWRITGASTDPAHIDEVTDMTQLFVELQKGLSIPIHLDKLGDSKFAHSSLRFSFQLNISILNGAYLRTIPVQNFDFKFRAPTTQSTKISASTTVYDFDWTTPIYHNGSAIQGSVPVPDCAGGYPFGRVSGTCGDMANEKFGGYIDDITKLIGQLTDSANSVNNAGANVLGTITQTIESIKASPGWSVMTASQQNALQQFEGAINTIGNQIASTQQQVNQLIAKHANETDNFTKTGVVDIGGLCSAGTTLQEIETISNQVTAWNANIVNLFTDMKTQFAGINVDSDTFNMSTALNSIQVTLTDLNTKYTDFQDKAAKATDGSTLPPDSGLTPNVAAPVAPTTTPQTGLPKWAVYVLSAVGALLFIGIVIAIYRARQNSASAKSA